MTYFTQCDFCTGTRWLQDSEFLGPCACVTPANLREANLQINHLENLPEEGGGALSAIGEHLRRYMVNAGMDPNAVVQPDPDLDAITDLLELWGC